MFMGMLGNEEISKTFLCGCDFYNKFLVYAKSSSVGQCADHQAHLLDCKGRPEETTGNCNAISAAAQL